MPGCQDFMKIGPTRTHAPLCGHRETRLSNLSRPNTKVAIGGIASSVPCDTSDRSSQS